MRRLNSGPNPACPYFIAFRKGKGKLDIACPWHMITYDNKYINVSVTKDGCQKERLLQRYVKKHI